MSTNLLIIEDSTINAMFADPRVMDLLPCLAGPKKQISSIKPGGSNCPRCQAEKKQIASDAMRVAKDCIRGLRGQRLNDLKKLLNTRQLRIITKGVSGKRVVYTL